MESITHVYNMMIRLDVKRQMDQGSIQARMEDHPDGTLVYFNKSFKDIDSIVVTVINTTLNMNALVNFIDIPDPTFFRVLVYKAGAPQTALVAWMARGVI